MIWHFKSVISRSGEVHFNFLFLAELSLRFWSFLIGTCNFNLVLRLKSLQIGLLFVVTGTKRTLLNEF